MGLFAALGIEDKQAAGPSKPSFLGRCGAIGAFAAFAPGEAVQGLMNGLTSEALRDANNHGSLTFYVVMSTAMLMGVYAVAYSIALTIGQNRYLHRPRLGSNEAVNGVGGGALIGIVSGGLAEGFFKIAQAVGGGNSLVIEAGRIVAWAIFGGLIGLGMSFIIPNLGRLRGLLGGAAGGAVGAVGFILCTAIAGDAAGRFIGMAIVGWALGYAIGLVEEASRAAWLQVTHGNSREVVKVSLGPDLVCVGSNSQRCSVWAQGARPVALRFRYVDGKVTCDDMASERSMVVDSGFQQQVGNVNLVVCVGNGAAVPAGGGPALPPPPVAPPPPPPPAPARPIAPRRAASGNATARPPGVPQPLVPVQPVAPARRGPTSPPPPPPPPPPPRR